MPILGGVLTVADFDHHHVLVIQVLFWTARCPRGSSPGPGRLSPEAGDHPRGPAARNASPQNTAIASQNSATLALQSLAAAGLIRNTRGRIVIRDRPQFQEGGGRAAEKDPAA